MTTAEPRGLGRVKTVEDVKGETLVGDLRDLILQEMRDAKNALPWTVRSEKEQREMIERAGRFAAQLVQRTVAVVAADGRPHVPVSIEKYEVGKALKVTVTAVDTIDNILTMSEGGKAAYIVFTNADAYEGEREAVKPTPDQASLIEDDDDDKPVFDNTPSGDH